MKPIEQKIFKEAQQPLFERRGLMLDISRNRVPTMDCLKRLIDALALLRYNELQLYTEHTFAYKAHDTVWKNASAMTAEEICEIGAYCTERDIELVPNQNSFGHMERWLQHSEYRHLAESPDGFIHPISGEPKQPSTLYPSNESLEFIEKLYDELLPNFRSKQLHVGGDEPWELGKGRSKELTDQVGKHQIYLDYMKGVFEIAKQHGRSPQFWADIILERPDLVSELPNDAVPVVWGYDADSPYAEQCATMAKAGFANRYYVAPGAGNWNSFGGRLDVARTNIALAAREGHRHHAKGLLLTAWGDNGHHQPWETLYPSLILAAQASWGSPLAEAELPALIDQVFQLRSGNGATLCELGKIDSLLPQPLPPMSFLHAAFFADEAKLEALTATCSQDALTKAYKQLNSISAHEAVNSGIQLGIEMNLYALERCLNLTHRVALGALKVKFEQEWLSHSRPGGLAESLSRFP